jgi:uncharacterized protein YjiS (DUF1127 family)
MSIENDSPDMVVRRVGYARRRQAFALARLLIAPFRWLGRERTDSLARASLDQMSPALLTDVGLRRVGDMVIAAETPDCANNNCPDAFTDRQAA